MSQKLKDDISSNRALYRTGLTFAILGTLCWIAFVVGLMTSPLNGDIRDAENYLLLADSLSGYLYAWGGILGSLFFVPAYLAIYRGFYPTSSSTMIVALVFILIGTVFITLGFMMSSGSHLYTYSPLIASVTREDAILLTTIVNVVQDVALFTWNFGTVLTFGGPLVWMAWIIHRHKDIPMWLHWAGIIGGLAGFAYLIPYLPVLGPIFPQAIALPLVFVNIILPIVWFIGLCVILLRRESRQPFTTASV